MTAVVDILPAGRRDPRGASSPVLADETVLTIRLYAALGETPARLAVMHHLSNLQPAHASCNRRKHARLQEELV